MGYPLYFQPTNPETLNPAPQFSPDLQKRQIFGVRVLRHASENPKLPAKLKDGSMRDWFRVSGLGLRVPALIFIHAFIPPNWKKAQMRLHQVCLT